VGGENRGPLGEHGREAADETRLGGMGRHDIGLDFVEDFLIREDGENILHRMDGPDEQGHDPRGDAAGAENVAEVSLRAGDDGDGMSLVGKTKGEVRTWICAPPIESARVTMNASRI
jgi:hypothetical protein